MITRLSESTPSVFQRRAYWTGSIVMRPCSFRVRKRTVARAEAAEGGAHPGRVRKRVVESVERVRARHVDVELLVEVGVDDRDLYAAGVVAPEERDGEAVLLADRELAPGVVLTGCVHDSSVWVAGGRRVTGSGPR